MSIEILQTKIGVAPDGDFGLKTFNAAMAFYKMTPARAAHFFGQTAHETAGFKIFSENLNYSSNGLKKIFGTPEIYRFMTPFQGSFVYCE